MHQWNNDWASRDTTPPFTLDDEQCLLRFIFIQVLLSYFSRRAALASAYACHVVAGVWTSLLLVA